MTSEVLEPMSDVVITATEHPEAEDVLDIQSFAELGARVQLFRLAEEKAKILRAFPRLSVDAVESPDDTDQLKKLKSEVRSLRTKLTHLRKQTGWTKKHRRSFPALATNKNGRQAKAGRHKTKAERKAISLRMKAIWRERRKSA